MSKVNELKGELKKAGGPERAKASQRYFKTGKGQYGFGDVFLGVSVPVQRAIAKKYRDLQLAEVEKLLQSKIHEERLTASIILVDQFKKADDETKKAIYEFYLLNTRYINNWDIIDGSAGYIVGEYLVDKDKSVLTKLAKSDSIWERRIAIISTFAYITRGDPGETLKIAAILVRDDHDLIQKAVGWMLREVGKRCGVDHQTKRASSLAVPGGTHRRLTTPRLPSSLPSRTSSSSGDLSGQDILEDFLKKHYKTMPRTMLRYAIERFPEAKRQAYLKGEA